MSVQIRNLVENFPDLVTLARGSAEAVILDLRAAENATSDSLIFVGNQEHFRAAQSSAAKTWLVAKEFEPKVPANVANLLVSPSVPLAMSGIAKKFFPQIEHFTPIRGERIHPSA